MSKLGKNKLIVSLIIVSILSITMQATLGISETVTNKSGVISSSSIWTKSGSPYNLTGDLFINKEATLTIEAGVKVNLNIYRIRVNGTLMAQGSNTDNIVFVSDPNPKHFPPHTYPGIWLDDESYGVVENAIVNSTPIISQNSVILNNNTFNGLARVPNSWSSEASIYIAGISSLSNNIINSGIDVGAGASKVINNTMLGTGLNIQSGNCTVQISNNRLIGDSNYDSFYGIFLNNRDSSAVINDNFISNFKITCIRVENGASADIRNNLIEGTNSTFDIVASGSSPSILNNTITGGKYGIKVYNDPIGLGLEAKPLIKYNNIYDNQHNVFLQPVNSIYDYEHKIYLQPTNGLNYNESIIEATYNWWGTTDTQAINQTIYDIKNNSTLATVNFVPFLTEQNSQAMPQPLASPPVPELSYLPPNDRNAPHLDQIVYLIPVSVIAAIVLLLLLFLRRHRKTTTS